MRKRTLSVALTLLVLAAAGTLLNFKASSQTTQNGNPPQSRLGIYGVMGFVIAEVDPGSTAEQAGLKPGDIVTSLNGQVTGIREFQSAIWSSPPGTTLNIEYLRFNPATGKAEENKATVRTMPFTSRAQSTLRNVRVSATTATPGPADCPGGCCNSCQGFVPEKYCITVGYFTGFRSCTSNGISCKGIYCA